jgi:hypothetical protein
MRCPERDQGVHALVAAETLDVVPGDQTTHRMGHDMHPVESGPVADPLDLGREAGGQRTHSVANHP